jgi:hypothetical protein
MARKNAVDLCEMFAGARIIGASVEATDAREGATMCTLSIETKRGRVAHVLVYSDPEGNGPGALHVLGHDGELLGIVGGR